jgi:Type VI secretion system/phage-baseplate injector OB domain
MNMNRSITLRCTIWPVALTGAVLAASACWAQAPATNSAPVPPSSASAPAAGADKVKPASLPVQTFAPGSDDSVVVAFPAGQLRAPVVTGGLYNGSQPPPVSNGQQPTRPTPVPTRLPIRTRGLPASGSQVSQPPASASKSKCSDGSAPDACKEPAKRPAHTDKPSPTPRPTP